MAIHDAGMFTVKGINRLKILQTTIVVAALVTVCCQLH